MARKKIPSEVLTDLHRRLCTLAGRSHERRTVMKEFAELYGVSEATLYRALRERVRPKPLQRSDCGIPRLLPKEKMELYWEIVAAIKVRTSNKQGRHLSTSQAIRLLEDYGIDTAIR